MLVYAGVETGSKATETINPRLTSFLCRFPSNPHMLHDLDHISVLLHISANLIYGCVKQWIETGVRDMWGHMTLKRRNFRAAVRVNKGRFSKSLLYVDLCTFRLLQGGSQTLTSYTHTCSFYSPVIILVCALSNASPKVSLSNLRSHFSHFSSLPHGFVFGRHVQIGVHWSLILFW